MGKVTTRQRQCARMFCALGYMPSGASSLAGNFSWESGSPALPTKFRMHNLDHGSQGMGQWRLERLNGEHGLIAFVKRLHPELTSYNEIVEQAGRLDYQVRFVDYELGRDYPELQKRLKRGGLVNALTADVCWQYERPNRAMAHLAERIAFARAIFADLQPAKQPMTIMNALDVEAAGHDETKIGASAVAAMSTAAGSAVVVNHVAPDLSMLEWAGIAGAAVIAILCIVAALVAHEKSTQIKAARLDVDKTADPKLLVEPQPAAEPKPKPAPARPGPSVQQQEDAGITAMLAAVEATRIPVPQPAEAKPEPVPIAAETIPASPTYTLKGQE